MVEGRGWAVIGVSVSVVVKPGSRRVEVKLESHAKVVELLRSLGYRLGVVVVVREGEVLTEDEELRDGDELVIYEAISGGLN